MTLATKAERYRDRAEQCLLKAVSANDPEVKMQFTGWAAHWHELAEQAERDI